MKHLKPAYLLFILLTASLLAACSQTSDSPEATKFDLATELLTVYKSPTCGCCNGWIDHVEAEGFKTVAKDVDEMSAIKKHFGIAGVLGSCHTTVSKQGFLFEGHIPARHIHAFLKNPPTDAKGLAVPAMPVGSPGMEVGDKFMPYQVMLIKKDGSVDVFADVTDQASQYQHKKEI